MSQLINRKNKKILSAPEYICWAESLKGLTNYEYCFIISDMSKILDDPDITKFITGDKEIKGDYFEGFIKLYRDFAWPNSLLMRLPDVWEYKKLEEK